MIESETEEIREILTVCLDIEANIEKAEHYLVKAKIASSHVAHRLNAMINRSKESDFE